MSRKSVHTKEPESSPLPPATKAARPRPNAGKQQLDFPRLIWLRGEKIRVRWVTDYERGTVENADLSAYGFAYDLSGNFYAMEVAGGDCDLTPSSIQILQGKRALHWLVTRLTDDAPIVRELRRAIDNPQFEFMPLVATREVPKRMRKSPGRKPKSFTNSFCSRPRWLNACANSTPIRRLKTSPTPAAPRAPSIKPSTRRKTSNSRRTLNPPRPRHFFFPK